MRSTLCTCLLMLSITALYFIGCQTTDQQADISDLQQDTDDGLVDDTNVDTSDDGTDYADSSGVSHPKEASAWFTRKLIMTSRQPSADRIAQCKERVESLSTQAANLRALEDASAGLENSVSDNHTTFHWCFYQMMSDLDTRLGDDSSLMDQKAELFMSRMKSLWILARALDASRTSNTYIKYLRARYTDINQNIFGRRLEKMNAEDFRLPARDRGKSAAAFDE